MDPTLDNELLREIIARTEAEEERNNPMFPRGGTDEIDREIESSEFKLGGQSVYEMKRALDRSLDDWPEED